MTRTRLIVLGVIITATASTAVTAIATTSGTKSSRFDAVKNAGTPVAQATIDPQDEDVLSSGGATMALRVLGERGNWVFYSAAGRDGGLCHAVAVSGGHIASLFCPARTGSAFPSEQNPIRDFSGIAYDPSAHTTRVLDLIGFAADGIVRVGVIASDGTLYEAQVTSNIYQRDLPDVLAEALVAFDSAGVEVYRKTY